MGLFLERSAVLRKTLPPVLRTTSVEGEMFGWPAVRTVVDEGRAPACMSFKLAKGR
jgi:hypothetical protein